MSEYMLESELLRHAMALQWQPACTEASALAARRPRCEDAAICVLSGGRLLLTKWVAEVATLVKLLDSIHPVTVGLDGFYSFGSGKDALALKQLMCRRCGPGHAAKEQGCWHLLHCPPAPLSTGVSANPFSVAANYNADFLQISSVPEIDFASFNIYPDLWNVSTCVVCANGFETETERYQTLYNLSGLIQRAPGCAAATTPSRADSRPRAARVQRQDAQWVTTWVSQHASDGASMGKPVLVKELGMQASRGRTPWAAVYFSFPSAALW